MTKKFIPVVVIAVVLALALGTGIGILATGTAGSADDPLITLSYLNEKFKVSLMADIDALIKTRGDEISAKVDASRANAGENTDSSDAFKILTIKSGQTLMLNEGSEMLVREGTALVTGAAIANTTTGESSPVGATALINNMYLATVSNSGIKAGSETVKALIRGEYTISG